jgi:hypothetical protein
VACGGGKGAGAVGARHTGREPGAVWRKKEGGKEERRREKRKEKNYGKTPENLGEFLVN